MELRKVNDQYAHIIVDGERVGHLEKHVGGEYVVEVFYKRLRMRRFERGYFEMIVENMLLKHKLGIIRSVKRIEKYDKWTIKG